MPSGPPHCKETNVSNRNIKGAVALAAAAAAACTPAWSREKNVSEFEAPAAVVTVEGMTEYRLPNGLKVVLYPDHSKPTATVNMTYLVGSRHENYGETGMAHLLEHLMFKGSKNYPNPTAEFTKRGFRMNGSTWLDRTNYFVSFTASEDNMAWALGWSADAMTQSFISQKDLATEVPVVSNEYELGENRPISVLLTRRQGMLFDWHAYGRSTIGARSDIENVEIENLQAFYRRYYQPDNAVLTVSGKFDEKQVLGWITEKFGPIPRPERTLPKEWTVEPTADGEREFTIRRPGETQLVAVGYRIPAALHDDYEPVSMAAGILADQPTGRLYKALVETGMATQVFAWPMATAKPGFVMFGAMVKKGEDITPVKTKLVETIEGAFAESPVTGDELVRHQTEQATMFERTLSDPEQFGVDLSDYIALGDWRLFFADREMVKAVKAEDIDRAAATYFVRDNRVVGLYLPTEETKRAEIPAAPSAETLLSRFRFSEEGEAAEAFDVSQDNINARTRLAKAGAVELALLPKQTRGKTVNVVFRFLSGNQETQANAAVPMLVSSMLSRGTRDMTRDQIDEAFVKLEIEGSPYAFRTSREHLPDALRLMGKLLSESSFPEKEFETLKRQTVVGLQARSDDPGVRARDAMTAHFNTYPKGDARYNETSAELIAEVEGATLADVKDYFERVTGTERGFAAVVGDFDSEAIETDLASGVLGVKASQVPYERIVSEYRPVAPARIVIDTPHKENAYLAARVDFPANSSDADMPALVAANWILGGSTGLSNRIVNRLRQKEGLSYGAGSGVTIPGFGNRAKWSVMAIVAPQNMAQAEASLRDEVRRAFEEGVTEAELSEAKRGIIESRAVSRAQDQALATGWVGNLEHERDWSFSKQTEEKIAALTVDEVNAALRRFADPDKLTFVLAGDLAKAREAGKDFSEAAR